MITAVDLRLTGLLIVHHLLYFIHVTSNISYNLLQKKNRPRFGGGGAGGGVHWALEHWDVALKFLIWKNSKK